MENTEGPTQTGTLVEAGKQTAPNKWEMLPDRLSWMLRWKRVPRPSSVFICLPRHMATQFLGEAPCGSVNAMCAGGTCVINKEEHIRAPSSEYFCDLCLSSSPTRTKRTEANSTKQMGRAVLNVPGSVNDWTSRVSSESSTGLGDEQKVSFLC